MLLMDTKPNEILLKEGDKMLQVPMINPFCSDVLSHHSALQALSEHSLVESNTKGWPTLR